MPRFEISYATRSAPILARNVVRDFGAKDHPSWRHLQLIRDRWKGRLGANGVMSKEDALIAKDTGIDGIIVRKSGSAVTDLEQSLSDSSHMVCIQCICEEATFMIARCTAA